jgi:ubiquinone/menaquinone biosynthesis C-methylase UbiE
MTMQSSEIAPPEPERGWRKKFMALLMAKGMKHYEKIVHERKELLFAGLQGTVVEIGPGTGTNLRFLSRQVRWIGIEPSAYMHEYLHAEALRLNFPVDIRAGSADNMPLPDASVDAVISTLVLCSVPDLDKTLNEIHRVLKPGGRLLFIEHVAAEPGTLLRGTQKAVKPLWRYFGDGCCPDRDTGLAIRKAGFEVEYENFRPVPPPMPIAPHISGVAVK